MGILDIMNRADARDSVHITPWDHSWDEWPMRLNDDEVEEPIHDEALRSVRFTLKTPTRKLIEEIVTRSERAEKRNETASFARWFVSNVVTGWSNIKEVAAIKEAAGFEPLEPWEESRADVGAWMGRNPDMLVRLVSLYISRWRHVEKKTSTDSTGS